MDPLSITTACLSTLALTARTVVAIKSYVSTYKSTRSDLTAVIREIADFETILEILKDDNTIASSGSTGGPSNIIQRIGQIIEGCNPTIQELQTLLVRHQNQGVAQAAWWMITGKEQVVQFQSLIAAHRAALSLALDAAHR